MSVQYQLLIRILGNSGRVCLQMYDGEECLDVRDLSTRVAIQIRAKEVSPYRHTLLLKGVEYQILNITRH